jgi:hypothetical protein
MKKLFEYPHGESNPGFRTENRNATAGFTEENCDFQVGCSANAVNSDPDLAKIIAAWPTLPEALRAGILAMVNAASPAATAAKASKPKSKARRRR